VDDGHRNRGKNGAPHETDYTALAAPF